MRVLPLLAGALLLAGCTAPLGRLAPATSAQPDRFEPPLPASPEVPAWGHPCPLPHASDHVMAPASETWRVDGCIVAQDALLSGAMLGKTSFEFDVPAHATRVRTIFHVDGSADTKILLKLGGTVVAQAAGAASDRDTIVLLDVDQPAAGTWDLRAALDTLQPMQGWWATVVVDLAP